MAALTIDKADQKTGPYTKWRARLSERFGENRSARRPALTFDVASIMVGIIMVGIAVVVVVVLVDSIAQH